MARSGIALDTVLKVSLAFTGFLVILEFSGRIVGAVTRSVLPILLVFLVLVLLWFFDRL